jgi:electron transfer flavoprotein alpha/beta subunit
MGAKKKEVRSVHVSSLSNGERTQSIDSAFIPTASKETETIEGDADHIVERIVSILKSDIKVI